MQINTVCVTAPSTYWWILVPIFFYLIKVNPIIWIVCSSNFISFGPIEVILEACEVVNLFLANPVFHSASLSLGREQTDFLFLHYLINGGINSSQLLELATFNDNIHRTRNPPLFFTPYKRFSYLKYSGTNRILEAANNRNADIFNISIDKIKNNFFRKFIIENNDCFTLELLNYSVCWLIVFMWWYFYVMEHSIYPFFFIVNMYIFLFCKCATSPCVSQNK